MPFSVSSKPTNEELSEAVNYLLSNFSQTMAINPNTGAISTASYGIVSYLYKFLQIRYADSFNGQVNFSNSPTNRLYYGIRNDDSGVESLNSSDYLWLPVTGGFGTTKFVWYATTGGRQIELFIGSIPPSVNFFKDNGSAIDLDLLTIAVENITTPSVIDYSFEIQALEQAIGSIPQPQLGTMAPLQQDNLPWVKFDTTPQSAPSNIGAMSWNTADQTLDLGMEYDVTQQIGLEYYARVQNNTGVLIPNGTVVGFTGAVPDSALSVAPYLANGSQNTLYILGVMTHDLPDTGQKGYCTAWGFVRDLNTSAFTLGDVLYASPTVAGAFTNIKPTAPNNVVPIAAVLKVGTTDGIIFVRPTIQQQLYYGEFTKTNSQTPLVINTAYPLLFTNTEIANGVSIGTTTSEIHIDYAGLYNIACSVQITSTNASQKSIWVWLRKNGTTNFPNSARVASITLNNGYVVITLNELNSLQAGDFIEVMYASDDTNISIATVAATAFAPAAPAVILAVTQTEQ